ncbi:MAG: sigma-54-dependent Fis family transcriptional regulator, partial [Deltaproteobacteria bacterium]|nr:sigma-54-dependent Fis family transcriptional regulator [Deltaproteobacteria bacterium]
QGIEPEAMNYLMQYHWPGNVRELENIIERMVILTNHEMITFEDLPEKFHTLSPAEPAHPLDIPEEGISLDSAVSEYEKRLILEALNKTGWVKNTAAQLLNLNRTTLIEKIKRQNLQRPSSSQ